jgi:hypothetical protein
MGDVVSVVVWSRNKQQRSVATSPVHVEAIVVLLS